MNQDIFRAIEFATLSHEGQKRKGEEIPYIVHPFEVAMTLQAHNATTDQIIAGLLHDVLEDCDVSDNQIRNEFGDTVCEYVVKSSETLEGRETTPWRERKENTIDKLKDESLEVKMVACADKLSNINSMVVAYEKVGNKLWDRFNAGYEEQKWYYNALVDSLIGLENYGMYEELKARVAKLF